MHQVGAVVERNDLHVLGQDARIEFAGLGFDALQDILSLLAGAEHDDAFDGIVLLADPKLTKPRSDSQFDVPDILDVPRDAIVQQYCDVADVLQRRKAPEAADVIELTAFGIESTARVSIVRCKRALNLLGRQPSAGETVLIEQHLVLHRPAAEAGIVGNPRYRSVLRFDRPVLERLELGRRAVGTLKRVTIDEAGGRGEWLDVWRDPARQVEAGQTIEHLLPREIAVSVLVEGDVDGR